MKQTEEQVYHSTCDGSTVILSKANKPSNINESTHEDNDASKEHPSNTFSCFNTGSFKTYSDAKNINLRAQTWEINHSLTKKPALQ